MEDKKKILCLSILREGKKIGEAEHLERPRQIHTELCAVAKDTLYKNKKGCVNIDIHDRVCRGKSEQEDLSLPFDWRADCTEHSVSFFSPSLFFFFFK